MLTEYEQLILAEVARLIQRDRSNDGTYEEIPGPDGEPDYCGLTYKQRP